MFKTLPETAGAERPEVTLVVEGTAHRVAAGQSLAAALLALDVGVFRETTVSASPRAPYCMMGVCFDCLMEVDGVANIQTCMVEVRDGMTVRRQAGAPGVES